MEVETVDQTILEVHLSYRAKVQSIHVPKTATGAELIAAAKNSLFPSNDESGVDGSTSSFHLKLLWKGKRLAEDETAVFTNLPSSVINKPLRIMVLETRLADVEEMNARKSDPTIRGFDNERRPPPRTNETTFHWGPDNGKQNKDYKFCKIVACSWQSFGHRPNSDTPHDFEAKRLLDKMATDPGVVAVLKERELVVGTLGEMDPIDDRLMQQKQQEGGCLLGYNTNAGARIDIKLRNDNLKGFRAYPELVSTLIHELSHNWVGEHNLLFWTNFGQMRVEYLFTHMITMQGTIVNGKTTAQLAELPTLRSMREIFDFVMNELAQDMRQHGLTPDRIASAIQSRCDELVAKTDLNRNKLGGGGSLQNQGGQIGVRERARQAAERRAAQNKTDKANS
jgi:WLM domain